MRTTLEIDDDVLLAAKELAAAQRSTAGKVLSELARKGLGSARKSAARRILAGGMAHEITNPTHGILLSAQLLGKAWQDLQPLLDAYFQDNPQARVGNVAYSQVRAWIPEVIADIQTGAERIKSIVATLREHAREERASAAEGEQE
jgi:polar amino acid transport system substrate-binding protein